MIMSRRQNTTAKISLHIISTHSVEYLKLKSCQKVLITKFLNLNPLVYPHIIRKARALAKLLISINLTNSEGTVNFDSFTNIYTGLQWSVRALNHVTEHSINEYVM